MSIADLKETYGKGKKTRQLYNSAIRTECPGAGQLLELLELVSSMQARTESNEESAKLKVIEDRMQGVREAMVSFVKTKFEVD